MTETTNSKQLLHLVFGGELKSLDSVMTFALLVRVTSPSAGYRTGATSSRPRVRPPLPRWMIQLGWIAGVGREQRHRDIDATAVMKSIRRLHADGLA